MADKRKDDRQKKKSDETKSTTLIKSIRSTTSPAKQSKKQAKPTRAVVSIKTGSRAAPSPSKRQPLPRPPTKKVVMPKAKQEKEDFEVPDWGKGGLFDDEGKDRQTNEEEKTRDEPEEPLSKKDTGKEEETEEKADTETATGDEKEESRESEENDEKPDDDNEITPVYSDDTEGKKQEEPKPEELSEGKESEGEEPEEEKKEEPIEEETEKTGGQENEEQGEPDRLAETAEPTNEDTTEEGRKSKEEPVSETAAEKETATEAEGPTTTEITQEATEEGKEQEEEPQQRRHEEFARKWTEPEQWRPAGPAQEQQNKPTTKEPEQTRARGIDEDRVIAGDRANYEETPDVEAPPVTTSIGRPQTSPTTRIVLIVMALAIVLILVFSFMMANNPDGSSIIPLIGGAKKPVCTENQTRYCAVGQCSGSSTCVNGEWSKCSWDVVCTPGAEAPCVENFCTYAHKICNECGTGYGACIIPAGSQGCSNESGGVGGG